MPVEITTVLRPEAFAAIQKGDAETHNRILLEEIDKLSGKVDSIVLGAALHVGVGALPWQDRACLSTTAAPRALNPFAARSTARPRLRCTHERDRSSLASPARVYPYGAPHTAEMIADLSRRAYEYRAQVLRMVYGRKSGHIGGAFSIAEILACLYFHQLRLDPAHPNWGDRDRLVFSKGHACAMLYTCLAHRGFFPVEELPTFRASQQPSAGPPRTAARRRALK